MRLAPREETGFSSSEYRYQVLQLCGQVPWTSQRSTLENVLETLIAFRKEWYHHQPFPIPFDVCQSTGLCPDVVLKICEYLLLNESINAFTPSILPLLRDGHSKVHLKHPSKRFVEMLSQNLDPRQVTSLRIADDPRRLRSDLSAFRIFDQLISLTILSDPTACALFGRQNHLPKDYLDDLLLERNLYSYSLSILRQLSSYPITHLHIRCTDDCYDYFWPEDLQRRLVKNSTITSFTFDAECYPLAKSSHHCFVDSTNYIDSALSFVELLVNVRRVRLIVNRYCLEEILEARRWRRLMGECIHLNRVIVQLKDYGDLKQEATSIERELRQFRPGMIFRIKTS